MNKLGRKTFKSKGKRNTVYKGKSRKLKVEPPARILFNKAITVFGRKEFCRKTGINFHTISKKLAGSKMLKGGVTPIFAEDIQDWFYGLTGTLWKWGDGINNNRIRLSNENLILVGNFIEENQ